MEAKKCHWCGLDIGNGNFEVREMRLLYFCCLLHIYRWKLPKVNGEKDAGNTNVFVCGKFIGKLGDFELE